MVEPKCFNTNYFNLNKKFNIQNTFTKRPSVARPHPNPIILKADTGASSHYIRTKDTHILTKVIPTTNAVSVHLPNNATLNSTKEGQLPITQLDKNARKVHILPALTNASLLSIGQLCDNQCLAIFTKYHMYIIKYGHTLLKGNRNFMDGLWDVPFDTTKDIAPKNVAKRHTINFLVRDKTSYELANFLHACAGSPSLRTFQQAINNIFFRPGQGSTK